MPGRHEGCRNGLGGQTGKITLEGILPQGHTALSRPGELGRHPLKFHSAGTDFPFSFEEAEDDYWWGPTPAQEIQQGGWGRANTLPCDWAPRPVYEVTACHLCIRTTCRNTLTTILLMDSTPVVTSTGQLAIIVPYFYKGKTLGQFLTFSPSEDTWNINCF